MLETIKQKLQKFVCVTGIQLLQTAQCNILLVISFSEGCLTTNSPIQYPSIEVPNKALAHQRGQSHFVCWTISTLNLHLKFSDLTMMRSPEAIEIHVFWYYFLNEQKKGRVKEGSHLQQTITEQTLTQGWQEPANGSTMQDSIAQQSNHTLEGEKIH